MTTSGQPSTFSSLRLRPAAIGPSVTFFSISLACGSLPVTSITIASAALPGAGAIRPMPTSPPGTPFMSSKRQAQPLVDARPSLLKLTADVLGERLHHRVGHQVAKLGLVPMFAERVDVGDGEEALRGIGQERFAGAACLGRQVANAGQTPPQSQPNRTYESKKRGTARLLMCQLAPE